MYSWDKLKNKVGDIFEKVGDGVTEYVGAMKDRYIKDMVGGGEYSEGNRVMGNAQVATTQAPPAATVNPNVHANAKAQNVTITARAMQFAKSQNGMILGAGLVVVLAFVALKK